jgi:thermostable 8-oxoguanine DNA glycosylase
MKISAAERKQIENEMIFRRINEKVGSDLDDLDKMHTEDGNAHLRHDDLILLQFKCECSDENCTVRIPLRLSKYREIHSDRSAFIVKKDHEVDKIEKVIHEEDGFNIVRKNNTTPEPGNVLNTTRVDNSHSKNR